ncbi:MAG: hypothetical protein R3F19_03275 [Verrucomicrobiales bacterium]
MDRFNSTIYPAHPCTERLARLLAGVLVSLAIGCTDHASDSTNAGKSEIAPIIVDAVVLSSPDLPSPETAPYRDCLFTVQCQVERSISGDATEGNTFHATTWAFRNKVMQAGQELTDGALIRFTLVPLDLEGAGLGTTMRIDETDALDRPEFWVQSMAVVKPGAHVHVEPPVYGAPLEELAPLNLKLVERGEGFTFGQEGFCFGMPTREIYRKDFWKLPDSAPAGTGSFSVVLDFHQQLAAKGIPLLFVVVPRASTIFADLETGMPYDWQQNGPVNAPVEDWCEALREQGVHVLNLTSQLLAQRYTTAKDGKSYPVYLPNDSHWSPFGAQASAKATADYIRDNGLLKNSASLVEPVASEKSISHRGDFADLMTSHGIENLDVDTVVFPVEPAPANANYQIQLLGDSLTRIFDDNHSSYGDHLQARIGAQWYIIAPNAGVTTSRKIFSRKNNLDEVDLVIWEVAEEFLAMTNMWRLVPLNTDNTLQLWRDGLLSKATQPVGSRVQAEAFEDPSDWDRLVGIRVPGNSTLTWKISPTDQAQLTMKVRVGPTEAGVAQRAGVTFRVLEDGNERYRTGLVPRRDRHVLSETITIPLPKKVASTDAESELTLITEVAGGTPPPWIDWVTPEVFGAAMSTSTP